MVLSLDFKKCFDLIEHCAIIGALKYFEFSEYLIKWTQILYHRFTARIQNNGYFTEDIPIEKGVRQGGPASTTLFLACAEILAIELKNNKEIKGIPVQDIVNLLSQFADDADIFLLFDQKSLDAVVNTLDLFQKNSGFTVSYDKTQIYRIGSLKSSQAELYTRDSIRWTSETIKVLGVKVHAEERILMDINYDPVLAKVEATLKTWENRSLSLNAKVTVINSLVGSLFVYKMMVLPTLPKATIQKFDKIIEAYLWNGHRPKIPLKRLRLDVESGGLKLVDLQVKDKALKATWANVIKSDHKLAEVVYAIVSPILKEELWNCQLYPEDLGYLIQRKSSPFWYDTLLAYFEIKKRMQKDQSNYIWMNSNIKVEGRPILWEKPFLAGLKEVAQLYHRNQLKPAIELCRRYDLDLMQLNSLVSAIPKQLKKQDASAANYQPPPSKISYSILIKDTTALRGKCDDWNRELGTGTETADFLQNFSNINKVTNIRKYRAFQYRLLHRAIILNTHLCHWGKRETNLCSLCGLVKESYTHLFVMCKKVQEIWIEMEEFMYQFIENPITFGVEQVIGNSLVEDPGNV